MNKEEAYYQAIPVAVRKLFYEGKIEFSFKSDWGFIHKGFTPDRDSVEELAKKISGASCRGDDWRRVYALCLETKKELEKTCKSPLIKAMK